MLVGWLAALRRYPIKSLRGEPLEWARVEQGGIPGDRASALFVRDGHARVGKTYRAKEHDRLHLLEDETAAVAAAAERGVAAEVRRGDHFFDDAPISILIDRWLAELSRDLGYAVEWERFRPNFFVHAAGGFVQSENELVGASLRLGTALLRVRSPIERCVAVTYHPRGDHSDPRILRYVAERRNAWMGIYCDVAEPGSARVGDELIKEAPLSS
jgi:uncharacterized protein